ncbi:MAG: DUF3108 domain-containing protein [Planctomycetes bacterium]|nr:DUF3108 domain-containing protein [Planctomycetota bacterium]
MGHRPCSSLLLCLPLAACAGARGIVDPATGAKLGGATAPTAAAGLPRPGERLEFSVALAGLPVGRASLQTAKLEGGWQIDLSGTTNAVVDWFCQVRGFASSRLRDDLQAQTFALWFDEDGERSARSLAYDEIPTLWYRAPGEVAWLSELTQYARPRDPLSFLQELRTLAPETETRDYEVAMTLRSFCYRVRWLGRTDVAVDAGEFAQALLWRIEVMPYEELGTSTVLGPLVGFYEVAISADAQRLPLRVTREFGFGQVALDLDRAGQVAPAPSTASTAALTAMPASAVVRE